MKNVRKLKKSWGKQLTVNYALCLQFLDEPGSLSLLAPKQQFIFRDLGLAKTWTN